MRVLKFGGTSVANAKCFSNVANIAINTTNMDQTALVLSAPAKITNYLVALVQDALKGNDRTETLSHIKDIVMEIITNLSLKYPSFDKEYVLKEFNHTIELIEKRLLGVELLGECPLYVEAFIESRGESFSILIMEKLLESLGKKVRVIDPVYVLVTEGGILESSVDINKSRLRYNSLPDDKDAITLMSGFCGGDKHGNLVLLGRNGSDYSAACLAAISDAKACEIWTDVDGVYSCDPRFVKDAFLLKRMSYKEAMELSYFGAKVMHPRTIAPIAQYKIPCYIKNTNNLMAEGTLISDKVDLSVPIKGISDLKNISLINISGPGMKGMVGMAGRLFGTISRANVSIVLITQSSSEYSISFCVHTQDVGATKKAIEDEFLLEFNAGLIEPLEIVDKRAIISVVGDGMRTMKGTSGRFFKALAKANINVNAIAQGSSERSISAVIKEDKVFEAISICHMSFFSSVQILDIVLVGVGGVGLELLNQIKKQSDKLKRTLGINLRVVGLANSKSFITNANGFDLNFLDLAIADLKKCSLDFTLASLQKFCNEAHLVNPILVDCTSSQSLALTYAHFMELGFHIVTPNKKANTSSYEYYKRLREVARITNRKFLYEANVGAGLPVINTLQNLLAAGDRLLDFGGIMSGTLSYIFGRVDEGMSLSEATYDAYQKGYTEPNPRDDLDGMDVARKLLILARECGMNLSLEDIKVEPPVDAKYLNANTVDELFENLKKADVEFMERANKAKAQNKVLRYVATIKEGQCICQVQECDESDPLYKVKNGENALAFKSEYYNPIPLVIRGYGAGTAVTAAGVLADILRVQSLVRES